MKLRYKLLAAAILWGWFGLFVWYKTKQSDKALTSVVKSVILPSDDSEQISVNPLTHQLIIIGPDNKKTVETLPDRVSTIDIRKNGSVSVTSPQFGLEHEPFIGTFYSNGLRFGAGLDGLYYKKLDLGLGFAGGSGLTSVVFVQLSYTVWDNVKLGLILDHEQHFGVGISVRL
jgi:hypothetical protein